MGAGRRCKGGVSRNMFNVISSSTEGLKKPVPVKYLRRIKATNKLPTRWQPGHVAFSSNSNSNNNNNHIIQLEMQAQRACDWRQQTATATQRRRRRRHPLGHHNMAPLIRNSRRTKSACRNIFTASHSPPPPSCCQAAWQNETTTGDASRTFKEVPK